MKIIKSSWCTDLKCSVTLFSDVRNFFLTLNSNSIGQDVSPNRIEYILT
jgi:hypothetical protein